MICLSRRSTRSRLCAHYRRSVCYLLRRLDFDWPVTSLSAQRWPTENIRKAETNTPLWLLNDLINFLLLSWWTPEPDWFPRSSSGLSCSHTKVKQTNKHRSGWFPSRLDAVRQPAVDGMQMISRFGQFTWAYWDEFPVSLLLDSKRNRKKPKDNMKDSDKTMSEWFLTAAAMQIGPFRKGSSSNFGHAGRHRP